MQFDPFVLPFTLGLIILLGVLTWKFTSWMLRLEENQKDAVRKNIFTVKTLKGIWEIFSESLLHRRIFRKNRLLGYMHMSLAFGWFLLIVAGHFETTAYFGKGWRAPYVPIFLRYVQHNPANSTIEQVYWFVMDFILLFVLSGVALAWIKRIRAKAFGMRSTTLHPAGDRIALSVLWFIFPFRLLAESITSAYYGGGSFLTGTIGHLLAGPVITHTVFITSWWMYSLSLGIFFIALPFSRYMHIPGELAVILLRNWGVKASQHSGCGMNQFEMHACSSCGICLDACQLNSTFHYRTHQSPYIYRAIRSHQIQAENVFNCLMCGRCEQSCVVGIETNTIRMAERRTFVRDLPTDLSYLPKPGPSFSSKTDVIYFAGCMSHLTPAIKQSMQKLFKAAGVRYSNLDQHESICCGRPMMLAGMKEQATAMIFRNKKIIEQSGAKTLVTSCPICLRIFRDEYNLNIKVLHHTQYIDQLMLSGKIVTSRSNQQVVYHDPCELGRGIGIYEEPRSVIREVARLTENSDVRSNSLCCGGSIANTVLTSGEQKRLATETIGKLVTPVTEAIITSCPLCKKTFAKTKTEYAIMDIAELVASRLVEIKPKKQPAYTRMVFHEIPF
jgi:Fe-S oxidoreductase